jgi:hypothetical protein
VDDRRRHLDGGDVLGHGVSVAQQRAHRQERVVLRADRRQVDEG